MNHSGQHPTTGPPPSASAAPPAPPWQAQCDHVEALQRIEAQIGQIATRLERHERHVGDSYATIIGDGLAVQMRLQALHTDVQALRQDRQAIDVNVTVKVTGDEEAAE